jgi:hypothetical protein
MNKYALFISLAFIAGLAINQADAAPTVTAAVTAPAPPPPAGSGYCPTVPANQSGFLTTDSQAWFVFTYTGGSTGDNYVIQWINPSGTLYTSNAFTQTTTGGSPCYNYFIGISGFAPATSPGTWHVNLTWNGQVISSLPFTISAPIPCTSFGLSSGASSNYLVEGPATATVWSFTTTPSNCNWTATYSSVITSISPASGTGASNITGNYPLNNSSAIETGTVTVSSGSASIQLVATIDPVSCTFAASPTGFNNVSGQGASLSVTITPSPIACGWFLFPDETWITTTSGYESGTQTIPFTVAANTANTARSGSLTTYGGTTNTTVPVNQLPTPPPVLQVSTNGVSNSGSIGTTISMPSVSLSSSNSTQITYTVSSTTSVVTGLNWLQASVSNTTTPATLNISANMQGFAPGSYSGTVTITPTSPAGVAAQVITVGVTAQGSDILQFTYSPAGNQTLQLTYPTTVNGTINVTSSATNLTGLSFEALASATTPSGGSWLQITQNASQANAAIGITAQRGSLAVGTYTGKINFYDTNNNQSSVTVVFVVPTPPTLSAGCSGSPCPNAGSGVTGQTTPVSLGSIGVNSSDSSQQINFSVRTATSNTTGPNWLQASINSGTTPSTVSLTANAAGLSDGTYSGSVTISPTSPTTNGAQVIGATLVLSGSGLQVTWTAGAQANQQASQVMALTSPSALSGTINVLGGNSALMNYSYQVEPGANWLQVSPAPPSVAPGDQTPGTVTVTANATGLAPSQGIPYTGRVDVLDSNQTRTSVTVTLTVPSTTTTQTISHLAYGGGWQTSVILVNLDTVPAPYTLSFLNETGTAVTPPLSGPASGTIQPGFSQTIQTTAAAGSTTLEGWAQITSSQNIGGTAIFSYTPTKQEAAVPLLASGGTKLLIPFDVGGAFALGVAIANPNQTAAAQISLTMRTEQGSTIPMTISGVTGGAIVSAGPSINLAAQSHTSFVAAPTSATGETRGVIELDSNVTIYALGIRYNGQAFTSIDAVTPQPAATKTISHLPYGNGWQTTIIPVNTDTVPAPFNLSFWNESGTSVVPPLSGAATPSGTIQPGFSQTIATNGLLAGNTLQGWAQISSSQQIGGTAIFSYTPTSQEAAVPLLNAGGTRLLVPFDSGNGYALGIAIANPSLTVPAQITLTMRTEQGTTIPMTVVNPSGNVAVSAGPLLTLGTGSHTAFVAAPLNATGETRGVVEFDSSVPIYVLGIRYNGQAFTSIRALNGN